MYTGSNLLSQGYVYYKELDEYPEDSKQARLYRNVNKSLSIIGEYNTQYETANTLFNMARNERDKEIKFLSKTFGFNPTINLDSMDSGLEIIETFNSCVNIKKAYERNIKRILEGGEAQLDISSFFDTYIAKNLKRFVLYYTALAVEDYEKRNIDLSLALERRIDTMINKVLDESIKDALNSKTFNGKNKTDDTDKAYADLLKYINANIGIKSKFKQQLYDNYKLDEVKKTLISSFKQDLSKENKNKLKTEIANIVSNKANRYRQGGFTREYLFNIISSYMMKIKGKDYNITSFDTINSGTLNNMKADNMLLYGISVNNVGNILSKITRRTDSVREANVDIIEKLGKYLDNFEKGTIIYVSSKNYSINESFKQRNGFSSGEDIKLGTFMDILNRSSYWAHAHSLVGEIMQLLKGAVGEHKKGECITAIARYIGYFLFDDIRAIGENIEGSNVNYLHLFDLDGIYIPLSFFLELLGNAFNSTTNQPTNLVHVNIKNIGDIKYSHKKEYNDKMWIDQGQDALDQITISAKFLSNFKDIIEKLGGRLNAKS